MGASPERPDEAPTSASSPYVDPCTGFLRNEVSASTQEEIEIASDDLLPGRLEDLVDHPIPCTGDREHLQAIHRLLFEGIFDWAGELRTTDTDKQGTDFVPAADLEEAIGELVAELGAEDLLRGLPREQFIARLAHYYGRLNQIHPFREGNGRAQRMFWTQVALNAGWRVDFLSIPKEANNEASRAASQTGDLEPLIDMLEDLTSPAPSVEKGEAQVRSSVQRKQMGRHISGWLKAHANPTRMT